MLFVLATVWCMVCLNFTHLNFFVNVLLNFEWKQIMMYLGNFTNTVANTAYYFFINLNLFKYLFLNFLTFAKAFSVSR